MRWRGGCTMDGGAGGANGMRSRARARVRQLAPSSGRRRRAPPARAGVMAIAVLLLGSALAATPALAESAGDLNAAAHAPERSDPAGALEIAARAALLAGDADRAAAAEAALHRSHALRLLGRYGEALAAGESARQGADAIGDERTAARAAANLAVLYETGGLDAEALS